MSSIQKLPTFLATTALQRWQRNYPRPFLRPISFRRTLVSAAVADDLPNDAIILANYLFRCKAGRCTGAPTAALPPQAECRFHPIKTRSARMSGRRECASTVTFRAHDGHPSTGIARGGSESPARNFAHWPPARKKSENAAGGEDLARRRRAHFANSSGSFSTRSSTRYL